MPRPQTTPHPPPQTAAAPPPPAKQAATASPVEVTTKGGLKAKSRDGSFEVNLGGRIQVDAGFHQDDKTDHANGTELRRARLDVGGRIDKDWRFKLAYDFADNGVEDKAAYLAYEGWPQATVKAGLYTPPFTLSEATSSLHTIFMEEPMLVNAFKPDDRIGIGLESGGEQWSAQMALFGEGPGKSTVADDEARGASARVTWAPPVGKDALLHLGGAVAYQAPNSSNPIRFRARPEAHVGSQRMVDTKAIDKVSDWTQYDLELAAGLGPLSFEGEYLLANVNRETGQPDLNFSGYYGSLGWFLTGESRHYEAKTGSFGRIAPKENFSLDKGGKGAWEVAARYSVLDLTDANVIGGEEKNVTLGINWYLNPQLRLMANYVLADAEKSGVHDEPKLFQTRMQVDF
ncbi:MAG: OprO/OprP family phosphate-selective porin [Magnetococcus sp. YQC-3]